MRDSYLLCGAQHEDIWIQRRELGGVEVNRDRLRKLFLSDISFLHLLNFGNSLCLHHYKVILKMKLSKSFAFGKESLQFLRSMQSFLTLLVHFINNETGKNGVHCNCINGKE